MKNDTVSTSDNAKLPESMKQACCIICTLADVMKVCESCPFNAYRLIPCHTCGLRVYPDERICIWCNAKV